MSPDMQKKLQTALGSRWFVYSTPEVPWGIQRVDDKQNLYVIEIDVTDSPVLWSVWEAPEGSPLADGKVLDDDADMEAIANLLCYYAGDTQRLSATPGVKRG